MVQVCTLNCHNSWTFGGSNLRIFWYSCLQSQKHFCTLRAGVHYRAPTRLGRVAECPQRLRALAYINLDPHRLHSFLKHSAWLLLAFAKLPAPRVLSGAFAEEAEVLQKRRDVLTMSARQCRQVAEGVRNFISASKFWSRPKFGRGKFCPFPKVRKRREVFRNDKDSGRNLSRICGEVAERMRIY